MNQFFTKQLTTYFFSLDDFKKPTEFPLITSKSFGILGINQSALPVW